MNWIPIDATEHERRITLWREMENIYTPNWKELSAIFFAPSITVEELIEQYAAGERNFIDISLPEKADLTGINLAGAILTGARFNNANLTNAILTNTDLRYSWVASVNFTGANLERANIDWAYASGSIFENANLLNTVGFFVLDCYALYKNTIMESGIIIEGPYYGEG